MAEDADAPGGGGVFHCFAAVQWLKVDREELVQTAALRGHGGEVTSACFGDGGTRFLTASSYGTAKLWDAGTAACLRTYLGHQPRRTVVEGRGAHELFCDTRVLRLTAHNVAETDNGTRRYVYGRLALHVEVHATA